MAKINVTPEEYADVSIAFLLDKLLYPEDVVSGNERFNHGRTVE